MGDEMGIWLAIANEPSVFPNGSRTTLPGLSILSSLLFLSRKSQDGRGRSRLSVSILSYDRETVAVRPRILDGSHPGTRF